MTEQRIDHVAEALRIIQGHESLSDPHGLAQVHAQLAIAEQLRIANLIAASAGGILSPGHVAPEIRERLVEL